MEHQRGAFKVKPAGSADAVKESPKMHGSRGYRQPAQAAKNRAGILAK